MSAGACKILVIVMYRYNIYTFIYIYIYIGFGSCSWTFKTTERTAVDARVHLDFSWTVCCRCCSEAYTVMLSAHTAVSQIHSHLLTAATEGSWHRRRGCPDIGVLSPDSRCLVRQVWRLYEKGLCVLRRFTPPAAYGLDETDEAPAGCFECQ